MESRKIIKNFVSYYKPHKSLFILDTFCALAIAACNLFYPMITKNIINDYVPNENIRMILVWSIILALVYIFRTILTYIIQYWGHILGVRIQGDMRMDMFRHLQKLPCSYFDSEQTGSIMSRLVNDLFEVGELAHHGPEDLLISTVTIIGAFITLMFINVYLTLIVFVFLPVLAFFASITKKKMHSAFKSMREKTALVNADVATAISGVRVTKAYGVEEYSEQRFSYANENFKKARGEAYKAMGIFYALLGFCSDFLYLLVLVAGALFLYYKKINVGEFAAFILYIVMLITPIKALISIYEQIQSGITGLQRFCEVMSKETEIDNEGAKVLDSVEGDIKFENVSFRYEQTDIIKNSSFTIKKGQTTALVGGSGGGKTTICHLIMRFYEINSGKITIDNHDIREITRKSLRSHIGIVAQDVFVFDGTIKENIAFGKIDSSDNEIEEAAKNAGIHDYIMSLEDKYDTWVGERGIKLSGGQRQRISIARAFLKNPKILILDEATSALDNVTEAQIKDAINKLSKGRTVLVVAHRLSTIKDADKILVLEEGNIVEKGTHDVLININNGYYQKMWETVNT